MTPTTKIWLRGLLAAAIGGMSASTGAILGAYAGGVEIWTLGFWKIVIGTAVFGGLSHVMAYLQKSPLPEQ